MWFLRTVLPLFAAMGWLLNLSTLTMAEESPMTSFLVVLLPLLAVGCATVLHNTVDIYEERSYLSILFDRSAMADTMPLRKIVAKQIDERILAAVAQVHQRPGNWPAPASCRSPIARSTA
jgi:hypothetical protein